MRGILSGGLILASLLTGGGAVQAGIYNTVDRPLLPLPDELRPIRILLSDLRTIDDRAQNPDRPKPGSNSLRAMCLAYVDRLESMERIGGLSRLDRIDLGAFRIQLGRFDKAIEVLEAGLKALPADDPARFLYLLNLAAAYQGLGLLERAISYQVDGIKAWPTVWFNWTEAQSNWYRRCERYYLTLLHLRDQEKVGARWETVDALFPGVHFVGANGEYEAGTIAPEYLDKLPTEAPYVVLQLLIWQPADDRLYWLLGELLNSRGQPGPAFEILTELVARRGLVSVGGLFRIPQGSPIASEP